MSSSDLPQRSQDDHTVMNTSYDQSLNQTGNYSDGFMLNGLQLTILQIYKYTFAAGVLPLSVLGFVLNCISFRVWHCSRKHRPVVWLFQYLAVWDNLLLITCFIQSVLFLRGLPEYALYFSLLNNLAQTESVLTTLLISVVRWLSVSRRRLYQRMTGYHVIVTCVFVAVWCVFLASIKFYYVLVTRLQTKAAAVAVVSTEVLGIMLPVLAMLVVNLALVRAVCIHRQSHEGSGNYWKTTLAVLCIAGCSFLAYPVSFLGHLSAVAGGQSSPLTVPAVECTGLLLKLLNSSVNFIFYFLFATSFRSLLKGYLYRLAGRKCCPKLPASWKWSSTRRTSTIVSSPRPPASPLDRHSSQATPPTSATTSTV